MAQIDLKFATISIQDGYALAATVNNAGNYAAGVLAIAVSGLTGAVANGDTFAITGEAGSPTHTITGHTETGGNTTSVAFTTAIAAGGVTNGSTVTITKSGAVNNGPGYTAGATTMTISGVTGIIQAGDTFTVAGETGTPTHTVTGHSETSGNTTSVTFSTVLATGGVANAAVITFTRTGTVNGAAGYQAGATAMTITVPAATVVAAGDTFTVAGEAGTPTHTVVTHAETGGRTTSVTFTPALAGVVANAAAVAFLPHALVLFIGDGTLDYTEHRNIEYKLNQGLLKYAKLGDQAPVDVNLDFVWEFLTAASGDLAPTPEDAFKKRNLASNWVTSGADPCQPYSVDLIVVYTPPCGGVQKETIILQEFRYEELQHSFKDAQIAVKGKCLIQQAAVSRSA